jgi:hypothetical protein
MADALRTLPMRSLAHDFAQCRIDRLTVLFEIQGYGFNSNASMKFQGKRPQFKIDG